MTEWRRTERVSEACASSSTGLVLEEQVLSLGLSHLQVGGHSEDREGIWLPDALSVILVHQCAERELSS